MSSPLPKSKAEAEQVHRELGGWPLMTSRVQAFLVGLLLAGLAMALAI